MATRLEEEEVRASDAEASIVTKYDAEMAALQADVDQNEADSDAAELSLTTRMGVEEARAAAAEAAIQADVDANEVSMINADASLTTRLAAE